jgi:hypothetical protein
MSGSSIPRPEPGMAFVRYMDAVAEAWRNCHPACRTCEFLVVKDMGEACEMLHGPTIPKGECPAVSPSGGHLPK